MTETAQEPLYRRSLMKLLRSTPTLLGLAAGFALGLAVASASADVEELEEGYHLTQGYMMGWDVKKSGHTLCRDPYVWTGVREIECD